MSIKAVSWVFENSKLTGSARLILLAIADAAGETGGDSFPKLETIAEKAGVSKSTAQRNIVKAEQAGELEVFLNKGGSNKRQDNYRPNLYGLIMMPGYESPEGLTPRPVEPLEDEMEVSECDPCGDVMYVNTQPCLGVSSSDSRGVAFDHQEHPFLEHPLVKPLYDYCVNWGR